MYSFKEYNIKLQFLLRLFVKRKLHRHSRIFDNNEINAFARKVVNTTGISLYSTLVYIE